MSDPTVPICSLAGCGVDAVLVWLQYDDATETSVHNVFACVTHQIALSISPLIHLYTCTAPNLANLPMCDCTPVSVQVPGIVRAH